MLYCPFNYPSIYDINPDDLFFYPLVGYALLATFVLYFVRPYLPAFLQVRPDCCPRCRYDLRGDTASGCPECGWGREAAPTGADS